MNSRILLFIGGLLSGGVVGGAVVLLLAPHSGTETRHLIRDKAQEIVAAGKQAAAEKRRELQRDYEAAIRIPLPVERQNQP